MDERRPFVAGHDAPTKVTLPVRPGAQFICPECGSREAREILCVDYEKETDDPWTAVLQVLVCAQCRCGIPAHLAERWDGMTVEAAQKEWRDVYRATRPDWTFHGKTP